MPPRLIDMEPLMNIQCRDALGHHVDYKPAGRPWTKVLVQGNYEDGTLSSGFSAAIEQQIELMVLKTDLAVKPNKADRVRTPKVPSKLFCPINVQNDDTGEHWLLNLKEVNA